MLLSKISFINKLMLPTFIVLAATMILYGNPFQSKIQLEKKEVEKRIEKDIVYRGYVIIDNQLFALISIGNQDYEVLAGEQIGDYKILKVTIDALLYTFNEQTFRLEPMYK